MNSAIRAVSLLLLAFPLASHAETPEKSPAGAEKAAREQVSARDVQDALYVPPARGKPRRRVGGAVRGIGDPLPALHTLVPAHTGQTVSAQPSLFWHLGGAPPDGSTLVFTLIDDAHVDPLVEVELPLPRGPGIQRIDLAQQGASLERGIEYEWSVALVVDAEHRSNDLVAVGWIDRIDPPDALGSSPGARDYAAHGLWYDALAAAEETSVRDALLREVGLESLIPAGPSLE